MNRESVAVVAVMLTAAALGAWYFFSTPTDAVDAAPTSGGDGTSNDGDNVDVSSLETQPADQSAVRPVRNNNWGDLLYNARNNWRGQVGQENGYCVFDTPESGLRAAFINLHSYFSRGLNTVRKIETSWAPPPGNPTAQAINAISQWTGVSADQVLMWKDDFTVPLLMSICRFECGYQPGDQSMYEAALADTGL